MDKEFLQDVLDNVNEVRMNILIGFDKVRKIEGYAVVPNGMWDDIHEILQLQCNMLESLAKEMMDAGE